MASQVQHARALEALRALDAAKSETQQNTLLRNSLLDAEDMVLHLHQHMIARKLHDQVADATVAADESRRRYEEGLSYKDTTRRPPNARFYQDCSLTIPMEQLHHEETLYDTQLTIRRMSEACNKLRIVSLLLPAAATTVEMIPLLRMVVVRVGFRSPFSGHRH